ncbi:TadE family type IV pilus minor pilin [Nocardioides sp. CER19]|nr:TadE family type IV pilus minor pilin [Nocardioides sp. CER19]MDH2412585.1 TadE family type IV pilus minor pilin [Nocardioides sp. CER19]
MVLPALVAVTIGLVWLLSVGAAQVRTVDAARETARALARGDDRGEAIDRGVRVGVAGTRVSVSTVGEHVVATARARVAGPGGLFGFLPDVTVRARAVAAAEEDTAR